MGRVLGWALIGLLIYYFLYPYIYQTGQVRYRLTTVIDTPKGTKSGSGVWGYSEAPVYDAPVYTGWSQKPRVYGEAIPIDMGDNKAIYVVLGVITADRVHGISETVFGFSSGFMNSFPFWQFGRAGLGYPPGNVKEFKYSRNKISWARSLKNKKIKLNCVPVFTRTTLNDCPSLVLVDTKLTRPNARLINFDELDDIFGEGVSLSGMYLAVTDDPVSQGIERRLPWVKPYDHSLSNYEEDQSAIIAEGFSRADPVRF